MGLHDGRHQRRPRLRRAAALPGHRGGVGPRQLQELEGVGRVVHPRRRPPASGRSRRCPTASRATSRSRATAPCSRSPSAASGRSASTARRREACRSRSRPARALDQCPTAPGRRRVDALQGRQDDGQGRARVALQRLQRAQRRAGGGGRQGIRRPPGRRRRQRGRRLHADGDVQGGRQRLRDQPVQEPAHPAGGEVGRLGLGVGERLRPVRAGPGPDVREDPRRPAGRELHDGGGARVRRPPPPGDALGADLVTALDHLNGDSMALLHAYERYQGADGDGSEPNVHRQARAMSESGFDVLADTRQSIALLRSVATRSESIPTSATSSSAGTTSTRSTRPSTASAPAASRRTRSGASTTRASRTRRGARTASATRATSRPRG